MKKSVFLALTLATFFISQFAFSAEDVAAAAPTTTASDTAIPAPAESAPAPAIESAPAPVAAPAEEAPAETAVNENLEFVSGEVSAIDATSKSVTVKLYGENDEATTDKTLTVTTDASTDITDGEKDRELGSLSAGTEVDVEYDPATKKATYIFVY